LRREDNVALNETTVRDLMGILETKSTVGKTIIQASTCSRSSSRRGGRMAHSS
jgi:hypothetical protein